MKPIAIIAIIAAVIVVGGACAGVAFSGVLNGGTTGPGGDDPVVPTVPVEPTPTETPTETPTPTPTDSSMSYFSPMTSSGSSSSGSGSSSSGGSGSGEDNTPAECTHAESTYFAFTDGDRHLKKCKDCGYEVSEVCQASIEEFIVDTDVNTHQEKCKYCNDAMGSAVSCTLDNTKWIPNSEIKSTHIQSCPVCKYTHVETCYNNNPDQKFTSDDKGTHSGSCELCGGQYTNVACVPSKYEPKNDGMQHVATCVCGYYYDEPCPADSHYVVKQSESTGTHVVKCDLCEGNINNNAPCTFGEETHLLTVAEPVITKKCSSCEGESKTEIYASVGQTGYTKLEYAIKNATENQEVKVLRNVAEPVEVTTKVIVNTTGKEVKLNYGTIENIQILKSTYDETKCTVTVDGTVDNMVVFFNEKKENNGFLIYDYAEVGNNRDIYTADGMVTFAGEINTNKDLFEGDTVTLMSNIDLAGYEWKTMGVTSYPSYSFKGTFDGQYYTISNMYVKSEGEDGHAAAGLFGTIVGSVKNVIIDNATVISSHYAGGIVGYTSYTPSIINCTVKNSKIVSAPELTANGWDNGDKAGGIIGLTNTCNVVNCTVENTTIEGYRDIGGIVGYANTGSVTKNTVKNVTLTVNLTHNYKNYVAKDQFDCNQVLGHNDQGDDGLATVSGNIVENVNIIIPGISLDVTPGTLAELQTAFSDAVQQSTGDITINLKQSFDTEGKWTAITPTGYNGVNDVIINGNGYTIYNLNEPLMVGSFGGYGSITINDLTIDKAKINGEGYNGMGLGAFVAYSDDSGSLTLNNCNLTNSVVTCTGEYAGGLVGYSSSNININDCTVTGSTIISGKSAGAIIGQDAAAGKMDKIIVTGCTISSTGVDEGKKYCGTIVGTSNAEASVYTDVTTSGNTINGVTSETYYGRAYVGLSINGTEYVQ